MNYETNRGKMVNDDEGNVHGWKLKSWERKRGE